MASISRRYLNRKFEFLSRQCHWHCAVKNFDFNRRDLKWPPLGRSILIPPCAFYRHKGRGSKRYKTDVFKPLALRIAQTWSSIIKSEFLDELQVLGDWELGLRVHLLRVLTIGALRVRTLRRWTQGVNLNYTGGGDRLCTLHRAEGLYG